MKKIRKIFLIFVIIFLLIISILFIIFTRDYSKNSNKTTGYSTLTKAICDDTYCQDYEITCNNNELVEIKPITGAILEVSEDWIDPRTNEKIEKLCE